MPRCLATVAMSAIVVVTIVAWLFPRVSAAGEVIRLTTQEWPPYEMVVGDRVDGVAVRVVRCVLGRLGIDSEIVSLNWPEAQQLVRDGKAEGFFAATQDVERDSYAILSNPIVPEIRRWYWRNGSVVDVSNKNIVVAVPVGTAMQEWLLDRGYTNVVATATVDELVRSLETKKVDVVLANQLVFDWNVAVAGSPANAFASSPVGAFGLGVYFRKSYLAGNPGFLQRFNGEAPDCRLNAHLSPN